MTTITTENPQTATRPLLVNKVEAARIMCLSTTEIDNLRRNGQLRAKKYGTKVLFPMTELEKVVDRLPWELDQ